MEIKTNSIGLRERPLENLRLSKARILAVGDSFTFGAGINRDQTWPAQLEHSLHQQSPESSIAVINAGIFGYNLSQIRDLTEELLPEVSPNLVILGVFGGGFDRVNDPYTLFGNIVVRRSEIPKARLVEGGLVYSHLNSPRLIAVDHWLEMHSYLGAHLFHGLHAIWEKIQGLSRLREPSEPLDSQHHALEKAWLQAGLEQIKRVHTATRSRKIPLLVMLIASFDTGNRVSEEEERINDMVREWCATEGIPTFNPTRALSRSQLPLRLNLKDHHWSSSANAIVGKELTQHLVDQHLLDGIAKMLPSESTTK
jgi:hypothetical protein